MFMNNIPCYTGYNKKVSVLDYTKPFDVNNIVILLNN